LLVIVNYTALIHNVYSKDAIIKSQLDQIGFFNDRNEDWA
jgi:hypothetical protein